MTDTDVNEPEVPESVVERQILVESLSYLYRSMPSAALGHTVAAGFIIAALYDTAPQDLLFGWFAALVTISMVRLLITRFAEKRLIDADITAIRRGAAYLSGLAFVQTSIWGSSVLLIWPDDIAHRSVLVAILAGIIAAGGIMLSLHRRSFLIYSIPITVPAVIQLVITGGQLEWILAALLAFYSALLYFSVTRLTNVFIEGLRIRFMIQTESRTDVLTTLANRRGFDEAMHELWQQSVRSGSSIGLLIIDVDFFKLYNDYYGHPQGDVALKKVGTALHEVASRSTDLCSRIGGEEFAVLMPATDFEGAMQVARSIQDELATLKIPHRNSERGVLTLSIGLNVINPTQKSAMNHFLLETDQALYEAKESGRDQICVARSVVRPSDSNQVV